MLAQVDWQNWMFLMYYCVFLNVFCVFLCFLACSLVFLRAQSILAYFCVFNCILVYSLNVSDGGLKSRLWWLPVLNASYAVEDNALHNGATSLEVG